MWPQQCRIRAMIHAVDAERCHGFVVVPEGATVTVVGHPDARHLVAVRWEGQELIVFEQDLVEAADSTSISDLT
ncbi:MAG TPA: hypothetical protein VF283_22590 [Bryobacteraceae bacterium]